MTRKRIDAGGNIVDAPEPAPPPGVVGKIEHTVTDALELPPDALRTATPELSFVDRGRLWLFERHVAAARWFRKRVLLMPDVEKMQKAQLMVGQQHLGFAEMVRDVRLRLNFYEHDIPLLGRSRSRYEAQQAIHRGKLDREKSPEGPTGAPPA